MSSSLRRLPCTVRSSNFLKELRLKPDVVHKASKPLVDVSAHIQHEQPLGIDLLNTIQATEAKLKDATTLGRKLRNPSGIRANLTVLPG